MDHAAIDKGLGSSWVPLSRARSGKNTARKAVDKHYGGTQLKLTVKVFASEFCQPVFGVCFFQFENLKGDPLKGDSSKNSTEYSRQIIRRMGAGRKSQSRKFRPISLSFRNLAGLFKRQSARSFPLSCRHGPPLWPVDPFQTACKKRCQFVHESLGNCGKKNYSGWTKSISHHLKHSGAMVCCGFRMVQAFVHPQ